GQFNSPFGIAVGSGGNIYVTDTNNRRVQIFNDRGVFQSTFGSLGSGNGQFSLPFGIAVDSTGKIYVSDTNNNRVQVFSPTSQPPVSTPEPSGIIGLGILGGGLVVRRLAKRR
ncbi:MAG: 6-bladed beta-propeller, partial [Microcystis panniformis]